MKTKQFLWVVAFLAIIAGAAWFFHKPEVQTQHQLDPVTNSTTPARPAIQVATSNAVTHQTPIAAAHTNLNEAEITAKYNAGLIDKDEAIQETLIDENKKSLDIYGKVIDQYGEPVVGAKVEGGILLNVSFVASGGEGHFTETDSQGCFSFIGIHGVKLGIRLNKEGYTYNQRLPSQRPENYQPDPNNPVIFTMWKLHGAETLVGSSIDAKIPHDGSPVTFDIATGKVSPTGDLRVTLTQFPLEVKTGREKFDWTVKIEIANGGLIEESDPYPYWAPADGYQSAFEFNMSTNALKWLPNLKKNFYTKNGQGQYSIAQVKIYPGRSPTEIEASFTTNPSGSQNLEPTPEK